MKRIKNKYIRGLSLVPPVYIVYFLAFSYYLLNYVPNDQWGEFLFPYLIIPHVIVFLICIILVVVVGKHIFSNDNLNNKNRIMWVTAIIVTMSFLLPVYCIKHMKDSV